MVKQEYRIKHLQIMPSFPKKNFEALTNNVTDFLAKILNYMLTNNVRVFNFQSCKRRSQMYVPAKREL